MFKYLTTFFLILILPIIDILSYFLFEYQFCHFLSAFLISYCWYNRLLFPIIPALFFIGVESFILYQSTLLMPLCVLPFVVGCLTIKNHVYSSYWYPLICVVSILLLKMTILRIALKVPLDSYTAHTVCVNIVVTWLFSLKFTMGKTRQSLMPMA